MIDKVFSIEDFNNLVESCLNEPNHLFDMPTIIGTPKYIANVIEFLDATDNKNKGGIINMKIYEISKIAATWWADVVIHPKFDNGDNSDTGLLGNMLQTMGVKDVTNETRTKFIEHLSLAIESKLIESSFTMCIGVDYHPDRILRESAEYAELSKSNFPIKTNMWISAYHVAVSYGYRAETEYLYTNKKYWSKEIASLNECIKEYDKGIEYYDWLTEKDIENNIIRLKKQIKECEINLEKSEV